MRQSHLTTTEQSEQTTPLSFVVPLETALPSEVAEMSAAQQEQADAVAKLLTSLERDTKKRQKWSEMLAQAMGIFAVSMLVIMLIAWRVTGNAEGVLKIFQLVNVINLAGVALGKFFLDKNTALELTKMEDIRCVGALVDVWSAQGSVNYTKQVREQAQVALTRLLPRLQAGDAPLLKESQRAVLRNVLTTTGNANSPKDADVDFTLAILKAFETVGDWKSAPQVKRLAEPANPKRIRAAAMECLPTLEALAEKQKPGETLLRASSAMEAASVSPEALLRPATPTQDTAPDTLLRPSGELSKP